MKINPITISLFRLLNEKKVNYCVLRNYENLPGSTGTSDLDIYVAQADHDAFIHVMKEVCVETGAKLVSHKEDKICPQYIVSTLLCGLQIDVYNGFAGHRACIYMSEEIITSYTFVTKRGIKALKPEADGMMCFLKETLNNKKCRVEYCEKARKAVEGKEKEVTDKILKAFSPSIRALIIDTLCSGRFDQESIRRVGISASNDLQSFGSRTRYMLGQFSKLKRFFKPVGYTIAFLGTDGAGKSTIIDAITPILNEAFHKGVRYEHMRPNYLPSLAVLTGKRPKDAPVEVCDNPHGGKPSGFLGSLMRLSYYWLDYTYGYFRKIYVDKSIKNHVWVFDRYFYDYINDPLRACIRLPKWLMKAYGLFVPTPDLTICLGANPEKIHARKPELPIEEVRRQIDTLKAFAESNNRAVLIDTGCSIEESVQMTMTAILEMMSKRFDKILR